jgi:signal transduction histidine kinase/HAMP domain-containing protein
MKKNKPSPLPTPSSTQQINLADRAFPELGRAQQRSVRLVISIPGITLLIVLASGVVLYLAMISLADSHNFPHETKEALERAAAMVLLLSILLSIIGSVVGYVVARQIVSPIRQLSERMEGIAKGDFSIRTEPLQLGEFGQLGSTFNRMVEQLNSLFEERDRQLRESFSSAHLVLASNGTVIEADQAVKRVFGLSNSDMINQKLFDPQTTIPLLKQMPDLQKALKLMVEEASTGTTVTRSFPIFSDGTTLFQRQHISCINLEGAGDQEPRILVEMRDITRIINFYEQMQRADRLAAVGTLATGIAHEIRNPLASIRGMIQLMEESQKNLESPDSLPCEDNYYCRILHELDRLGKLVNGIMDFANLEDSPAEPVCINTLLQEIDESIHMNFGSLPQGLEVIWELDQNLPKTTLQINKLKQGLLNLLTNAYQHCIENKTGPIRIQTMYLPVNKNRPVIICISNPSEHIDEELKDRLFEPFYTTRAEGTGLGLPIAYQTIVGNGGVLDFEYEEGEVQFWVRLPLDESKKGEKN